MKLIDRYILREMTVPFLIGQAAIVFMLIGTVLYNNANTLLQNQVPVVFVVRMVLFFLPFLVHMTMPVAMAVGASLAVSRLGRDSEITVMRASGVSLTRIFAPFFIFGLLVSVGDFYFGEKVVPPSIQRLNAVFGELPGKLKRLSPQAGQFFNSTDQSYALMVRSMTPMKDYIMLRNVLIVASPKNVYENDERPLIVYADKGIFKDGEWVLYNPFYSSYDMKTKSQLKLSDNNKAIFRLNTPIDPAVFQSNFNLQFPMWEMGKTSATRTFTELGMMLARNREQGIVDRYTLLDYHFKLSVPFSCFVMALCCPPLALRFSRGGGFMGTLLSIGLVFVYWNTMLLMRILGSPGPDNTDPLLNPILAAWSQNVIFAVVGLYFLRKSE